LFETLLDEVRKDVTRIVFTVQIRTPEDVEETAPHDEVHNVQYQHGDADDSEAVAEQAQGQKVGRNDPCPCGSGKKYKHCHGRLS
jgi:preprotein translocase subunit SecA